MDSPAWRFVRLTAYITMTPILAAMLAIFLTIYGEQP